MSGRATSAVSLVSSLLSPHIQLFVLTSFSCSGATSGEFNPKAEYPIIIFMPEISKTHMGGTMRLGLRPTVFDPDTESWSKVRKLYAGAPKIWERHRHRYEVNPAYLDRLSEKGMRFVNPSLVTPLEQPWIHADPPPLVPSSAAAMIPGGGSTFTSNSSAGSSEYGSSATNGGDGTGTGRSRDRDFISGLLSGSSSFSLGDTHVWRENGNGDASGNGP